MKFHAWVSDKAHTAGANKFNQDYITCEEGQMQDRYKYEQGFYVYVYSSHEIKQV